MLQELYYSCEIMWCTECGLQLAAVRGEDIEGELSATNTDNYNMSTSYRAVQLTSGYDRIDCLSVDSSGRGHDQNVQEVNVNDEASETDIGSFRNRNTSRFTTQLSSSWHVPVDSNADQSNSTIGNKLFPIHRTNHDLCAGKGQRLYTYGASLNANRLSPDHMPIESSKDQSICYKHVSANILKRRVCTSKRRHQYSNCQRKFSNYHGLVCHVRTSHHVDRPTACKICHRRFVHPNNLQRHMALHQEDSPSMVDDKHLYPEVGKTFSSRKFPDTNITMQIHGMGKSSPMGNVVAPTEKSVSAGRKSPLRLKKNRCTVCSKTFASSSELLVHRQAHSAKYPVACHICGKQFNYPGGLQCHIRTHTGEKPFSCSVCQQSFSGRTSLKTHMRRHTGEKPHACSICSRSFTTTCGLKRHLESHSGERRFPCEFCDKMFCGAQVLKVHMRTHSGERPFSCFICQSTFTQLGNLKTHILRHTGEKPHGCAVCGKQFVTAAKMRRHQQVHREKRKLTCDVCQRSFKQLCKLKQHASVHDEDKK